MKADPSSNDRGLSYKIATQFTKINFSWILNNISRNAQSSGLSILTPIGKGGDDHFTKIYSEWKVNEMSTSAHKTSCLQTLSS